MRSVLLASVLLSWSLAGCDSHRLPVVVQAAAPNYPKIAQLAHIEGDLVVSVEIAPNGTVTQATTVSGPALAVLRQECLATAKNWIFASSSVESRREMLTFEFKIAGEPGSGQEVKFLPPYRVTITAPPVELKSKRLNVPSKPLKQQVLWLPHAGRERV